MGKSITDCSPVTTVGLDLAKHVFQVHCADSSGRVVAFERLLDPATLSFGWRLETTAPAAILSPLSVTTPTARPFFDQNFADRGVRADVDPAGRA